VLPGFEWLRGQDLKRFPEGRGRSPTVESVRKSSPTRALRGTEVCRWSPLTATEWLPRPPTPLPRRAIRASGNLIG
jgi:hypothetical protein